jgi:hypothetical protein
MATPDAQIPVLFTDGYKNVTLHDLIIRMNLIAYYPSPADTAILETRIVGRLALSLSAFLRVYEGFGTLIKDLEGRGFITRTDAAPNA